MIERKMVDGKLATVLHLKRDLSPAEPYNAEIVKILFDNGMGMECSASEYGVVDTAMLDIDAAVEELLNSGTSEGAVKGWDTRGRGREEHSPAPETPSKEEIAKQFMEAYKNSIVISEPEKEALTRLAEHGQYVGANELHHAVKIFEEAKSQGFPPERVNIDFTDKQFKVGDRQFTEGGHYDPQTGKITVRDFGIFITSPSRKR